MKNKKFSLNESHEFIGSWWLPNEPEIKIVGVLKYKAEVEIELNLEGSFNTSEYEAIHGTASGYSISLINSFSLSDNKFSNFLDYNPSKIISNIALIGAFYSKAQYEKIDSVDIELGDIKKWTTHSGFTTRYEDSKYFLEYKRPESIIFFDGTEVRIDLHSYAEGLHTPLPERAFICEKSYFKITSKIDIDRFNYLIYTDGLRKFLTLASRTNIDYENICFNDEEKLCSILFIYPKTSIQYPSKTLSTKYSFFTLLSLSNVSYHFDCWIKSQERAPEAINLYFYDIDGMPYLKFLAIAQSLEEIYRDAYAVTSYEKNLGYKNIIKQFYERFPVITNKFNTDSEKFSKTVGEHRDFFSHWFDKKKDSIYSGIEFDILRRDINILFEMCLLEQCGFSIENVQAMVDKCLHYVNYIDQR